MKVIDKMQKLSPELKKYYLPCKAKTYLNELTNNSVMTILRQILRPHNYAIISREKYINREKAQEIIAERDKKKKFFLLNLFLT